MNKAPQQNQPQIVSGNKPSKLQVTHSELFCGPLPHPSLFQKYEEILPGSANRIMKMAEKQSNHRQDIEKKIVQANIYYEKTGIILGFVFSLGAIILGGYLILQNKEITGFITLASTLVFNFYNYYKQQKGKKEKHEQKKEKQGISAD